MEILSGFFKANSEECKVYIRPVRDVVDIVGGKWTLLVLIALSFKSHRFKELQTQIEGITPRMLSKVLKELELNGLIQKELEEGRVTITKYSLTPYGESLDEILVLMRTWGVNHRKRIMSI